ncbi:glycosyltransferase family A protein [Psychroserpens sp. SPM9]|uniref:glycosyltransferase family 2 protein n=1 Tax=Psychroserpens sp. SPM9 TaxID=2975598 RepID=UPI0021A49CAB|nr:glycosyltransferase family A protein [Psychroserpens sp. SPM9]MDG5492647.1 glycosyltransferase family A protein [Psychroserpens sp. SPM9]
MKPFFSVVIPLYNKERHIKTTIESVLNQTFKNFEIIVINDGSTDASAHQIEAFNDSRIQLFTTENHGVSYARNYGVEQSSADYICFLDADDIWHRHHLEHIKMMLDRHPKCGMYCKAYDKKINGTHYKCHYHTISDPDFLGPIDDYFEATLVDSIAYTSSVMIPKMIFKTLGGFNEAIDSGEDTELWIRIALDFDICFYNTISVTINQDADNRISEKHIRNRKVMDLEQFEAHTQTHASLRKYLDANRFSLGMQCKRSGENALAKYYFDRIDFKHMNFKQKLLISSPKSLLVILKRLQNLLRQFHINLSAFR